MKEGDVLDGRFQLEARAGALAICERLPSPDRGAVDPDAFVAFCEQVARRFDSTAYRIGFALRMIDGKAELRLSNGGFGGCSYRGESGRVLNLAVRGDLLTMPKVEDDKNPSLPRLKEPRCSIAKAAEVVAPTLGKKVVVMHESVVGRDRYQFLGAKPRAPADGRARVVAPFCSGTPVARRGLLISGSPRCRRTGRHP